VISEIDRFQIEVAQNIREQGADDKLRGLSDDWMRGSFRHRYSYNFSWLGRPIIQYPQDILAVQEIIWRVKPDLIIETGIAHGGSLILSASLLELIGGPGVVLGIDIDIRAHNRNEIEKHPMQHRIKMIEGSSVAPEVAAAVRREAVNKERVMVFLDSCHTRDHVLAELDIYAPLVTRGSYLVVFDTVVANLPDELVGDRPWDSHNSPMDAVRDFLGRCDRFEVDREIDDKLLISVAPSGYLRCVKD
jgi:cephalosporin hydroxylase